MADVIIAGEAEYIWKQFCVDFEKQDYKRLYKEDGIIDMKDVPAPRYDLIKMDKYRTASIQFSRGCPYNCEFCDIIIMFGRKPRYKDIEQIEKELNVLRKININKIFFVDDNFIGDRRKAIELLNFLIDYQNKNNIRISCWPISAAQQCSLIPLLSS